MRRALLLACVAFGWTDCLEPTEVMATITTNAKCSDVHDVSLTIGTIERIEAPAGQITTSTKACDPATGRIGSIALVPSSSSEPAAIRVVMGLGGKSADDCVASGFKGGCIVARRAVRYVKHSKLQLPIPMQLECVDVPCGATTTCVNGNCVPAMVDQCDPIAGCVPEAGPPAATARALGGAQLDVVTALALDPAANLHVTGQFGGSADFGGTPIAGIGMNSVFAASYDGTLALRWQFVPVMEMGTGAGETIVAGSQTVVGGVVAGADFGLGAITPSSAFVVGLDTQTGKAIAQRTYAGPNFVVGSAYDAQGNVYFAGTCAGGAVVAGATCANQQGFVASFDTLGNLRWTNLIGNPGGVSGLAVLGSHLIVSGSILAAFDFGGGARGGFGGSDAFVASYTLGGKWEWARVIGDSQLQNASRVTADANYVYAVGAFQGSLTDPDISQTITAPLADGFLWELSVASGAGHALRRLPNVVTAGVGVDPSGTVHVCGNFKGSTDLGAGTITSVGEDGYLASIDTGGTTRVLTFGGPGDDGCNAIAVESPKSVYIGGFFNQTMTIDGATLTSHGGQDGFIARVAR